MSEEPDNTSEIKETDIIFDCPYCSKSLAIDYRGAGLTIPCSDCGKNVQVPIPEGMELSDIDSTDEEQEIRIVNLRRSLAAAEFRIAQLEEEVASLEMRRRELEQSHTSELFQRGEVLERLATIEDAVTTLRDAVDGLSRLLKPTSTGQVSDGTAEA